MPLKVAALDTGEEISYVALRAMLKCDAEKPLAHGAALSSKSCRSLIGWRQDRFVIVLLPPTMARVADTIPRLWLVVGEGQGGNLFQKSVPGL